MTNQFVPEKVSFKRERAILEEIRNNPNQHHNALIKALVPKYMAKTTFEKTRDRLLEKKVIDVIQKGNKKIYQISKNHYKKSTQLLERTTHKNYQSLQNEIQRSKENYRFKDNNEKTFFSTNLLNKLLQTDNGFTVLDSVKNPKKTLYKDEHLEIQKMISFVFQQIINDKDQESILPAVMISLSTINSKNFTE